MSSAVRDVGRAVETLLHALRDSREDVARAFRGDTVDEVRLVTVLEGHDGDLAQARQWAAPPCTRPQAPGRGRRG